MADALTPPLLIAAAVLAVAAVAKLRAPAGAAGALVSLAVPLLGAGMRAAVVRAFAVAELALALWVLLHPAPVACGVIALLYAAFAVITLVLARRQASCGCFGAEGPPASVAQSAISSALAAVAVLAAGSGAHGVSWLLDHPAWRAAVLLMGIAGAVYGAVIAYTAIPPAWSAWSGR
jgi:hypothetical protein